MLENGTRVRIDTSECQLLCEANGCMPSHRKMHGMIGIIEEDFSKYDIPDHAILECMECNATGPMGEYMKKTGHNIGVNVDGMRATYHPDELIDASDIFRNALDESKKLSVGESVAA